MKGVGAKVVCGILFVAVLSLTAFFLYHLKSDQPGKPMVSMGWAHYVSPNTGVSFVYPAGWQVEESFVPLPSSLPTGTSTEYENLYVCPPNDQLILTSKEFANNCISIFSKNDILNPPQDQETDQSQIFADFSHYYSDPSDSSTFTDARAMESAFDSREENGVRMTGFYRNADQMAGVLQSMCQNSRFIECVSTFKTVLDSIEIM